ncbi:MAG TPA: PH domain-containing protein [Vicinamibacterales bacterium]|nr:PH domain-containing protein [Vicinamibacterales bacterium]
MVVRGGFVVATLLSGVILTLMCRAVRGYEVTPGVLLVRRLLWTTRVPLPKPVVTRVQPRAMAGSWRLWGNGGFFAFSGHFSNAVLGRYRAFVTDMARTVVLTTAQGAIVVSPDDPHEFVRAVTVATDAVS